MFIKQQHLESITEMPSRFKEYLKRTKDAEEAKFAKIGHLRDDSFRDDQLNGVATHSAPKMTTM